MLRSVRRVKSIMKNKERVWAQLVPNENVVLEQLTESEAPVIAAAEQGDWRLAAVFLEQTRNRKAWFERSQAVERLAERASTQPGWLQDWRATEPDNPDQLIVWSSLLIHQAWDVRGHAVASDTPDDAFAGFHQLLTDVTPNLQVAMETAPDDPEPWHLALMQARGLQFSHDEQSDLRGALLDRDPDHVLGHRVALVNLSGRWSGSARLMREFAVARCEARPASSPVQLLPLLACSEAVIDGGAGGGDGQPDWFIAEALDRATAWFKDYALVDPLVAVASRHEMAWACLLFAPPARAFEHFAAAGGSARTYPWGYYGDALEQFLAFRHAAATKLAESLG